MGQTPTTCCSGRVWDLQISVEYIQTRHLEISKEAPSLEGRGWGTDPVEIVVCWSKTQNNTLFGNRFRTKPPRGWLWPVKLVFDDYHTSRSSSWVMYSHGSSKPLINRGFQLLKIELIFDVFHENYSYELGPTASKWVLEKPPLVQPHTPKASWSGYIFSFSWYVLFERLSDFPGAP